MGEAIWNIRVRLYLAVYLRVHRENKNEIHNSYLDLLTIKLSRDCCWSPALRSHFAETVDDEMVYLYQHRSVHANVAWMVEIMCRSRLQLYYTLC